MRALARVIVLLALATLIGGCASDPSARPVADWTFVGPDGARADLTLPTHVDARLPWARTHYALVTTLTLEPAWRGRDLTLVFPRFLALVKLRVNGQDAASLFQDANGYRGKGPHAWRIPAAVTSDGALELELDVEHTWTMSAWLDSTPRLTTALDGGPAFTFQRAFDDFTSIGGFTCSLFAGYLYLAIYLTDRRRSTYVLFALTGLGGCLYPLFQSALLADVLGPLESVMTGVGVTTATAAEVFFSASLFGLPRPSKGWAVAWAVACAAVLSSVGYFTSTRIGGIATIAVAAPVIGTQLALFVRLVRRRPRPPNLFTVLGGWVVLGALAVPDFAAWLGLGAPFEGLRTASLGVFLVAFLTTAAISQSLTRSLGHADDLAAEREERIHQLEAQKREVELLNDELQRQIAGRSRALADAITHLAEAKGYRVLFTGDAVDDRYTVVRELGAGAAGSVYLVERKGDRALFAMKVVRSTSDRTLLARLAREAQLAAQVKHPNVITVVDVDVAQAGFLYIVMEYVAGASLRECRGDYGNVPWALDVLRQIAAGLAAVHESGIVHRDLKPANVLLVPRADAGPLVKIADFGIAGLVADEDDLVATIASHPPEAMSQTSSQRVKDDLDLTQTGVLMGTPLYMAPETGSGSKNAAPSVDLFSFGVIAFELLTGSPPFRDSPALGPLRGVVVPPAAPLGTVRPSLPPEITRIVDRCLAFQADLRPTASEVLPTLEEAAVKVCA